MSKKRFGTREEFSAGGVVFRRQKTAGNNVAFLLGKHSGYHKWVLPKGLVEKGESAEETAVREVAEEVGVEGRITDLAPLGTVEYYYFADLGSVGGESATGEKSTRRVVKYQEHPAFAQATAGKGESKVRVHKRVVFYLMEFVRDLGKQGWEMEDRRWLEYDKALEMLAFDGEREVLNKAARALHIL